MSLRVPSHDLLLVEFEVDTLNTSEAVTGSKGFGITLKLSSKFASPKIRTVIASKSSSIFALRYVWLW